jgi:hypothetical protein
MRVPGTRDEHLMIGSTHQILTRRPGCEQQLSPRLPSEGMAEK